MNKYTFKRDHRKFGGPVLSMCIEAKDFDEASGDFRLRWEQKCAALGYEDEQPENVGFRTTREIQASAMTPEALAIKRTTKGIKG